MSFLFGRARSRTASEFTRQSRELILKLSDPSIGGGGGGGGAAAAAMTKTEEELARLLSQMKFIFQGTLEVETNPEQVHQLVASLVEEDMLFLLAANLYRLPFESRKDTQVIFSYAFRFRPASSSSSSLSASSPSGAGADPPALEYVVNSRPQVLTELCRGYDHKESATAAGTVLREVLKNQKAAAIILYDDEDEPGSSARGLGAIDPNRRQSGAGVLWRFFDWIDRSSFEVSADAFTTFRELLTKHKEIVPAYLNTNFDRFFDKYNNVLVKSNGYVTKRQSIKLLGEILLDRTNYTIMTRYVDSGEHLKICMNLLRDERRMVQYEGFHVFKVFVANPHKSPAVQKILIMNRDKMLTFLAHFLDDRTEDEQFIDEREFLIKQIRKMPSSVGTAQLPAPLQQQPPPPPSQR